MLVAGAFPILAKVIKDINYFTATYLAVLMLTLFAMMAAGIFSSKIDIVDAAETFAFCMYIITGFVSLVLLRLEEHGEYYFLVPVAAPLICDIFAYLTGRLFGKHCASLRDLYRKGDRRTEGFRPEQCEQGYHPVPCLPVR
jgi:CDP-diglyceride synthetase